MTALRLHCVGAKGDILRIAYDQPSIDIIADMGPAGFPGKLDITFTGKSGDTQHWLQVVPSESRAEQLIPVELLPPDEIDPSGVWAFLYTGENGSSAQLEVAVERSNESYHTVRLRLEEEFRTKVGLLREEARLYTEGCREEVKQVTDWLIDGLEEQRRALAAITEAAKEAHREKEEIRRRAEQLEADIAASRRVTEEVRTRLQSAFLSCVPFVETHIPDWITDPKQSLLWVHSPDLEKQHAKNPFAVTAEIDAFVKQLVRQAGVTSIRDVAKCLHDWLAGFRRGQMRTEGICYASPIHVFRRKGGNCGELAQLFIVSMRLLGHNASFTPVRRLDDGTWTCHEDDRGHACASFRDGGSDVFVDPARGKFDPQYPINQARAVSDEVASNYFAIRNDLRSA